MAEPTPDTSPAAKAVERFALALYVAWMDGNSYHGLAPWDAKQHAKDFAEQLLDDLRFGALVAEHARLREALTWQPIATAPKDGTPFRAYGAELVHADFNPWGQVEAVHDGERLFGAIWDGQFDCWNSLEIGDKATRWQPFPASPSPVGPTP